MRSLSVAVVPVLIAAFALGACGSGSGVPAQTTSEPAARLSTASPSQEEELIGARLSCRDSSGDVRDGSTGDWDGSSTPGSPEPAQPGSDLKRFSMERDERGMTLTFVTVDEIPLELPSEATLSYGFVAGPLEPEPGDAVWVSAGVRQGRWTTEVIEDGRRRKLEGRPEVDQNTVSVHVAAADIPDLMRGPFRWRAESTWIPRPTDSALEMFSDSCPEGFRAFRGSSG